MALITAVSAGDVNVAANWSPAQVPTATDDVVIDGLVMTVPVGYSFQPQSLILRGSSDTTRGTLSVSGVYVASGGCSLEPFNELRLNAGGVLDLAGGSVLATNSSTSSTQPNFLNFSGASADWCQLIDSVGGGKIQRDNGDRVTGPLTMKNCTVKGLDDYAFKAGGSYWPGGHINIDGVVFRNSGFFEIGFYVNTSDDLIIRRFEVRGSTSAVTDTQRVVGRIITNALIGDGSGTVDCSRWVLVSENAVDQFKISLRYANAYDLSDIVTEGVLIERILGSPVTQNIDRSFFHFTTTTGGGGIASGSNCSITGSYVFTTRDNPHTAGGALFDDSVIEATYADAATDAGDHFIVPGSSDLTVSNSLILDGLGGVLLNALGSAATGNYAATHNTIISDVPNDTGRVYGHLARDENGGTFAGTLNLHDNLVAVRANPNGYTDIRAINLDTAGVDDQITAMDNNAYFGYAADLATLYFGVTSASKTVGDPGYGGNDVIGVDPQFVDGTRGFERYATEVLGLADLAAALDHAKKINGYNSTTETLDVASESGFDVTALVQWVRDGYAPTNSTYDGAASDGGTIGAVAFAAPSTLITITDNATGADDPVAPSVVFTLADSGAGADAITLLADVLKSITDSGLGSDLVGSIAASLQMTDAAAGSDAAQFAIALNLSDQASGSDLQSIIAAVTSTDTGNGSDALQLAASVSVADTGIAVDSQSITVLMTLTDTGTGADSASLLGTTLKTIADLASGLDDIGGVMAQVQLADAAGGSDAPTVQVAFSIPDTGAGIDAIATLQTLFIQVADLAQGTDQAAQLQVFVPVSDTGFGADAQDIQAILQIIDSAGGSDVALAFDAQSKIAKITFTLTTRRAVMQMMLRRMDFTLTH